MGIEAILALAGLIIPPAADFIKKKFLKKEADTPEATLSTLATTKPEVMPEYLKGQAGLMDAMTKFFNRDVCGTPSQWVVDLRASIRPAGVVLSFVILGAMMVIALVGIGAANDQASVNAVSGVRYACVVVISSWFGDRIAK